MFEPIFQAYYEPVFQPAEELRFVPQLQFPDWDFQFGLGPSPCEVCCKLGGERHQTDAQLAAKLAARKIAARQRTIVEEIASGKVPVLFGNEASTLLTKNRVTPAGLLIKWGKQKYSDEVWNSLKHDPMLRFGNGNTILMQCAKSEKIPAAWMFDIQHTIEDVINMSLFITIREIKYQRKPRQYLSQQCCVCYDGCDGDDCDQCDHAGRNNTAVKLVALPCGGFAPSDPKHYICFGCLVNTINSSEGPTFECQICGRPYNKNDYV